MRRRASPKEYAARTAPIEAFVREKGSVSGVSHEDIQRLFPDIDPLALKYTIKRMLDSRALFRFIPQDNLTFVRLCLPEHWVQVSEYLTDHQPWETFVHRIVKHTGGTVLPKTAVRSVFELAG